MRARWLSLRISATGCGVFQSAEVHCLKMAQIGCWVCFLLTVSALYAQTGVYVLKAARMFDGKSDRPVEPGIVVVSGNKIESVGGAAPAGATVVDLGDAPLLPGVIDPHPHLTFDFDPDYYGARLLAFLRPTAERQTRDS